MNGAVKPTGGMLAGFGNRYDVLHSRMGNDMEVLTGIRVFFCLMLWGVSGVVAAASLPGSTIPAGVGVNIHFTRGNTQSLDMIAAAGIRVVRMDFTWSSIEKSKGVYDWSAYDELLSNLESRGLQAYFVLDYSNAIYEQTRVSWVGASPSTSYVSSPQHPLSVTAFSNWAKAAAQHFAGHNIIWEIWNEPNLATFWKLQANVAQYNTLALATCSAIKGADASATVIGPATSGFPWDFLTSVLSSGLLNCIDAVSVHSYQTPSTVPENAAADYSKLAALIAQYAPSSRANQIQMISGEWGYYTASSSGVSPATQANYVVRQQLANLLSGVNLSVWYDWMNDGSDSSAPEDNFGLVNTDLSAKPSYTALQAMTQQLSGYHLQGRIATGNAQEYVLAFVNANGQIKFAYWTAGSARAVSLTPVVAGMQLSLLSLSLTGTPQYTDVLGVLAGS